ncbi:hypothetical protein C8R41DRAFT_259277 [Lentinula lateritia]|uniref:Secreted protein n=1 Tax=Lentinula lateritia TaxID=40482 RepID=A0ABQ8VK40_9AGAR|nr:hypothetical protein C8R41DRAFT_259277 [Lentinula lateritia]
MPCTTCSTFAIEASSLVLFSLTFIGNAIDDSQSWISINLHGSTRNVDGLLIVVAGFRMSNPVWLCHNIKAWGEFPFLITNNLKIIVRSGHPGT